MVSAACRPSPSPPALRCLPADLLSSRHGAAALGTMEAEFHWPPPAELADLPCGWEAVYDPSHGRHYYECPATGQRTWTRPDRNLSPEAQAALAFIADTYGLRHHVASLTGDDRGGKSLPRHEESWLHSGSRRTGASGRGREDCEGTSSSIEADRDRVSLARVRAVGLTNLQPASEIFETRFYWSGAD